MRQLQSMRLALAYSILLIFLCLPGLGGCGGGGTSTPPQVSSGPGMKIRLSANGPTPDRTLVSIGARGSSIPNGAGIVPITPPGDATSTTFVTEIGTNIPLLLGVVPKGSILPTGAPIEVSPRSTIVGLMFLESGAWLLPQDKQQQFFTLIKDDPKVTAAVTAFETVYQADGRAFTRLGTDSTLTVPIQSALDSVMILLTKSDLFSDLEAALNIVPPSKVTPRTKAWKVTGISTVTMTIDGNKNLLANNSSGIFRYVEVSKQDGSIVNSVMLPETTTAPVPLLQQPLSESPLFASVTGGLKDFDPARDKDAKHIYPVATTAIIRIVFPFISCLTGVNATLNADKIVAKGFPTGDPLFNELFKILVFNKDNPVDAANMPAGKLVTQLAGIFATHQHLSFGEYFSVFKDWILDEVGKAVVADLPDLTIAMVAEAATVGEKITAEAAKQALAALGGPYIRLALAIYQVLTTAIDLGLEFYILGITSATDQFTITGTGNTDITVRSTPQLGRLRALSDTLTGRGDR